MKWTASDFIQLATLIGVFVGSVLIVWELQQTRELTVAQLESDRHNMNRQSAIALAGENPMQAFAKACTDPASLSAAEYQSLNYVFFESFFTMNRSLDLATMEVYTEDEWRSHIGPRANWILSTSVGRAWWEAGRLRFPPSIRDAVDEIYASLGEPVCQETMNKVLSRALEIEQSYATEVP